MSRLARYSALVLTALAWLALPPASATAQAQRRGASPRPQPRVAAPRGAERPHPVHVAPAFGLRGQIFIGGYFYDPFYGPYPWWNRVNYPFWYAPVFDYQADVHVQVTPKELRDTAVYVDGFYAGIVDDFDGVFQSLPLPPGGHVITLYRDGYRTVRHNVYLARGTSFSIKEAMVALRPGERSEAPELAPPLPAPPEGSYRRPGATPPVIAGAPARVEPRTPTAAGFSTLDLFVQPANAEVTVDGERWVSNEDGHYVLQLPAGLHRVEVHKRGLRTYETEIDCREGETMPLNVSLTSTTT